MLKNLVCPYCYERFSTSEILFRCENFNIKECPLENDQNLANYFGTNTYMAHKVIYPVLSSKKNSVNSIFRKFKEKVKATRTEACDQCNKPTRTRICPNCHNQLPPFFHQAESHIISVIGARNSGKTHFITVLINELLRNGFKLNISSIPQDVGVDRNQVTSQRYKREYKIPLIDKGEELPQTQENAKDLYPLIYQIKSSEKGKGTKALYLVFYDTAGENFRDQQEIKKVANYISNSSGIIFLLDTFQIPRVKTSLRNVGIQIPNFYTGFEDVLDRVINLYTEEQIISSIKGKSNIPVAITFSKIDEVLKHRLFSGSLIKNEYIFDNSSFLVSRKYSPEEIAKINEFIRFNLMDWGEEGFVNKIDAHFTNPQYFGISALGNSPVKGRLEKGTVSPHRVLDPLIWILDQLHFSLPKV